MIIRYRKFLIGGAANNEIRKGIIKYAQGFGVTHLQMIDDVLMLLEFIRYSNEGNELLQHVLKQHNIDAMPMAEDHWKNLEVAPLRIYHLLKQCKGDASFLCSKIKIDGKHLQIQDAHEPGDNR